LGMTWLEELEGFVLSALLIGKLMFSRSAGNMLTQLSKHLI
jgi:hypothetical protein